MGCHTWFYQQKEKSFEQAKEEALKNLQAGMVRWEDMMVEVDDAAKAYGWNEQTKIEQLWYQKWLIEAAKQNNEVVIYSHQDKSLCYLDPRTNKYYEEGVTHDIIRVGNYPDIKFFSFDEMLKWIEEHREDKKYNTSRITNEEINDLKAYWDANPNSMVMFG